MKKLVCLTAAVVAFGITGCGGGSSSSPEKVRPEVSSVSPLDGTFGAAIASTFTVNFSEAMKASSITDATFTVAKGATPVAGTVAVALDKRSATFTPDAPLEYDETYIGTLTVGVEDKAGNNLAAPYTWSITTPAGTRLVSATPAGVPGNEKSYEPAISDDGGYVAFHSYALNLVAGGTSRTNVYVRDVRGNATTLVSVSSDEVEGNGSSQSAAISGDGSLVVFHSSSTNLAAADTTIYDDVYLRDLSAGTTTLVSTMTDASPSDGNSQYAALSSDGAFVAFQSTATKLVAGDTNGFSDIFVKELATGTITRVSVDSDGEQANAHSYKPSISTDGRYVAFHSFATNLVDGDTNGTGDVFVHDRQTGVTVRVSVKSDGAQATGNSAFDCSISANGKYVAFYSEASDLVDGDNNAKNDVFRHSLETGETVIVNKAEDGTLGDGDCGYPPAISADGRYVAFNSFSTNLVAGDGNNKLDAFVKDMTNGGVKVVSTNNAGDLGNNHAFPPALSEDARYVAFVSYATNMLEPSADANGYQDIFVRGALMPVE